MGLKPTKQSREKLVKKIETLQKEIKIAKENIYRSNEELTNFEDYFTKEFSIQLDRVSKSIYSGIKYYELGFRLDLAVNSLIEYDRKYFNRHLNEFQLS